MITVNDMMTAEEAAYDTMPIERYGPWTAQFTAELESGEWFDSNWDETFRQFIDRVDRAGVREYVALLIFNDDGLDLDSADIDPPIF